MAELASARPFESRVSGADGAGDELLALAPEPARGRGTEAVADTRDFNSPTRSSENVPFGYSPLIEALSTFREPEART